MLIRRLPALRHITDTDHRPCGAQCARPCHHVCRPHHRLDEARHRRDGAPPRDTGWLQQAHGITPKTIVKPIKPLIETTLVAESGGKYEVKKGKKKLTKKDRENLIKTLTREMQQASRALEFERAAELRDMILELDGSLPGAKASASPKRDGPKRNDR